MLLDALNIFGVLCTFWAAWFAWYVFSWQARHHEAEFLAAWRDAALPLKQLEHPFSRKYLVAVIDYYLWSRKYAFRLRPATSTVIAALFEQAVAMRKLIDEAHREMGIREGHVVYFFIAVAEQFQIFPRRHCGDARGRKLVAEFRSHLTGLSQPEAASLYRWAAGCSAASGKMESVMYALFDEHQNPRRCHAPLFQPKLVEWTVHIMSGHLQNLYCRLDGECGRLARRVPSRTREEWSRARLRVLRENPGLRSARPSEAGRA